jgi:NAD-dependent isocitrate dehydrogenase
MSNQLDTPTAPSNEATNQAPIPVTLIKGDGIGPEIAGAVQRILEAAGVPIAWDEREAGLACIDSSATGLPDETLNALRTTGIGLKGPTATPSGSGHKSVNVLIRKALDLYANVRPIRSLPGVPNCRPGLDMVIVRENIEDTYSGIEHMQTPDVAQCLKVITRPGSAATIRYAFELARAWGRKKVTCLHKANIHKLTDGMFLNVFQEIAQDYPDIEANDMLVDAACMNLVLRPDRFDVMVTMNLYGDIISDLCAGLIGGLGMAPGANIGDNCAVFEAVHGTAPDIAGQGKANPTALLLSATFMLRYLGQHGAAVRIETALDQTLQDGVRTGDLGGNANLDVYTEYLVARIKDGAAPETVQQTQRVTVPPAAAPVTPAAEWHTAGVDVFVQHEGLPPVPAEVGPLTLKLISNRGTKVYPGPLPNIRLVNWHRCRYVADNAVSHQDVADLLGAISQVTLWVHVEKLQRTAEGEVCYSKATGE